MTGDIRKHLEMTPFRSFVPVWLWCVLLPLPAIVFWRTQYGRTIALCLFFVGCASVVADAFRRENIEKIAGPTDRLGEVWRSRIRALVLMLAAAGGMFSLLLLVLGDARDFVAVALAFAIVVPSVCVVPHLMLVTQKRLAAVLFTLFAVLGMKLLGCAVVVLTYGWDADARGYTTMPWTRPNLLVWLFVLFTSALCVAFYFLGQRRFCGALRANSQ